MAITADTIDHTTLTHLVEAGAVRGAEVIGQPGGWGVVIKYGKTERALAARRGAVRNFKKFETLVSYLKAIGIAEYRVNAANYDPVATKARTTRPDATARLKNAHQAAAYNKWFMEQVEAGLKEADDPNTVMVPHATVKKDMAKQRKKLQDRIAAGI
jgi:ribonuclease HI